MVAGPGQTSVASVSLSGSRVAGVAARNLLAVLRGERPPYIVDPEALARLRG